MVRIFATIYTQAAPAIKTSFPLHLQGSPESATDSTAAPAANPAIVKRLSPVVRQTAPHVNQL